MKVRLGDICEILNGYAFKSSDYTKDGIRIIRISNVQKGFIEDSSPVFYPKDNKYAQNYALIENDLLISLTGNVGRVALISRDLLPAALNQRVACIRIKDKHTILTKYLFHLLNSDIFEHDCIISAQGIAQKNMSTSWLQQYEISIDPLETQSKRINVLDTLDSLISRRKRQLLKLDQLVKSRFMEMFGDPVINKKNWLTSQLSNHIELIGGYAFESSKLNTSYGIPVVKIGNINSGTFKATNLMYSEQLPHLAKYKLFPGDLVISLTGTIGKEDYANICVLGNDYSEYYLNQRNAKIQIKNSLDKYYLVSLLRFNQIKRQITNVSRGVRQANVSNKDILTLTIPLPPLPLQQQFAAFVEKVDKSKLAVKQSLEKLETLKKSLMQQYFG